jgi:hypothetical protein
MVIVGLADSLDPHARGPAAGRRVRATDDLPLAGLVGEAITDPEFHRQDPSRWISGGKQAASVQRQQVPPKLSLSSRLPIGEFMLMGNISMRNSVYMVPDAVRQLIRHLLEDGRLPRDRTIELWQGDSFGHTCDGCGLAIATADKMSLICADDWRAFRFHVDCFQVWDSERQARDDQEA